MHREHVCAGFNKRRDVFIRIGNHQMDIERKLCRFSNGFDYRWTDRNVWNEVPVHHVHVNQVGASRFNRAYVFAERSKVRRHDGRSTADGQWLAYRWMKYNLIWR